MKVKALYIWLFATYSAMAQEGTSYIPSPEKVRKELHPPETFSKLTLDLFEYKPEKKEMKYDISFWFGGDYNKLWLDAEGEHSLKKGNGTIDRLNLYYSRAISAFWDLQAGIGTRAIYGNHSENRNYVVLGIRGLAPYWFHIDANLAMDKDGNTNANLKAEYELLLTQRFILQPRFESLYSFSDIKMVGIASGLNYTELGLRLRYEVRREFAPYIGVSWIKHYGKTKRLLREEGEDTQRLGLVMGVRMWF